MAQLGSKQLGLAGSANLSRAVATLLEGVHVTHEPKSPTFTNVGLLDFVIEMIVREDEVAVAFHLLLYTHCSH
jgi:hypothetical protein